MFVKGFSIPLPRSDIFHSNILKDVIMEMIYLMQTDKNIC